MARKAKRKAVSRRGRKVASAQGVRILFNFNRCKGPLTKKDGLRRMVEKACRDSGVTVLGKPRFRLFPDGTMNATGDLSESHFGLGTYLAARHVAGEVNMCHERCDNTKLARKLVRCLQAGFKPAGKARKIELQWRSE